MHKTVEEFNKELNIIAIQVLEKQLMVADLRKAIGTTNQDLDKLLIKAGKVREGFKEFLDNNPDKRREFLGAKRAAEVELQEPVAETTAPVAEEVQSA